MINAHKDDSPGAEVAVASWRGTARLLVATASMAFVCGLPGSLHLARDLLITLL